VWRLFLSWGTGLSGSPLAFLKLAGRELLTLRSGGSKDAGRRVLSFRFSALRRGGALLPDPDACGYEGQGSVDASGGDTNRSSSRREWWARLVPSDDGRFGQCKFRNDHVEWMIYIDMITRPIYRRYRAAWWCRAILRERDAVRLQDK
jgi:hypothetical protein